MSYQKHKRKPFVYHVRYKINSQYGHTICTSMDAVFKLVRMVVNDEGGYVTAIVKRRKTEMVTPPLPVQLDGIV